MKVCTPGRRKTVGTEKNTPFKYCVLVKNVFVCVVRPSPGSSGVRGSWLYREWPALSGERPTAPPGERTSSPGSEEAACRSVTHRKITKIQNLSRDTCPNLSSHDRSSRLHHMNSEHLNSTAEGGGVSCFLCSVC